MATSAPELLPYAKIREDLFRPLSSGSARYWITICAALSVVVLGMVAWGIQVRDGYHLEIYDERFDPDSESSVALICAPV